MAIIQEHFMLAERDFIRTYSDIGMKVHGGFPEGDYDEASEPAEYGRTYTETNIPVEDANVYETAGRILMGAET